jgi:hypothetical protein
MGNGAAIDINSLAQMQARQLVMMDPVHQQLAIQNLKGQSPELADLTLQYLTELQDQRAATAGANGKSNGVDMRPMPSVLPPRRAGA